MLKVVVCSFKAHFTPFILVVLIFRVEEERGKEAKVLLEWWHCNPASCQSTYISASSFVLHVSTSFFFRDPLRTCHFSNTGNILHISPCIVLFSPLFLAQFLLLSTLFLLGSSYPGTFVSWLEFHWMNFKLDLHRLGWREAHTFFPCLPTFYFGKLQTHRKVERMMDE